VRTDSIIDFIFADKLLSLLPFGVWLNTLTWLAGFRKGNVNRGCFTLFQEGLKVDLSRLQKIHIHFPP